MTVREIQGYLAEMYTVDVSPDLISEVTDSVMSEATAWQSRPLETMYPVVFFDALRVKIREDAVVRSKAVYLALGILPDGSKDILGLWIESTQGAKFWMKGPAAGGGLVKPAACLGPRAVGLTLGQCAASHRHTGGAALTWWCRGRLPYRDQRPARQAPGSANQSFYKGH